MKSLAIVVLSLVCSACWDVEFTVAAEEGDAGELSTELGTTEGTEGTTEGTEGTTEGTEGTTEGTEGTEGTTEGTEGTEGTTEEGDAGAPEPAYLRDPLIDDAQNDAGPEWFAEGSPSAQVGRARIGEGVSLRASAEGVAPGAVALAATYFDDPAGISDFDGVAFWICGRGTFWFEVPTDSTVALEAETGEHNHFAREITLDGRWTFVEVAWTDLGQGRPTHPFDSETVRGLFFTVVGRDLDVWLDNVQFFGADVARYIWLAPTGGC
jgi:hypothetical protein